MIVPGAEVRLIDPRVCHDEAEIVLDHDHSRHCPQYLGRFAEHEFDQARILVDHRGQPSGLGARFDGGEIDRPALGLGDDFLRDDEDIPVGQVHLCALQSVADQSGQIVAGADLGQVGDGVETEHGLGAGFREEGRRLPVAFGGHGFEARGGPTLFRPHGRLQKRLGSRLRACGSPHR